MVDITVKVSGAFLKDPNLKPIVTDGITAGALYFAGKMSTYPRTPGGRKNPYLSDKQRVFLAIAVREGKIQIPYQRGRSPGSQKLRQSWTEAKPEIRDNGMTAAIGTNVEYARFVQDAKLQSRYHRDTGWKTDEEVKTKEERNVVRMVNEEIEKGIARMNK